MAIARQLRAPALSELEMCGFLDDYLPAGSLVNGRWPVLGPPSALRGLDVDEAIVVQHAPAWESLQDVMRELASDEPGPAIRLAPTFFDLLTTGFSVTQRANVPVVTVHRARIQGVDAAVKTAFEVAVAAVLLMALAPALIWQTLRRWGRRQPVFVASRYAGAHGRVVTLRSFPPEAPEGARLRRVVEKGPALLSVLGREIALIRPRLVPAEGQAREGAPPLLSVQPGLAGPVSVAPELDEDTKLALELAYIRDYSVWRDVQILCQRAWQLLPQLRARSAGVASLEGSTAAETEGTLPGFREEPATHPRAR